MRPALVGSLVIGLLGFTATVEGRTFKCTSGDVTCLLAAIDAANGSTREHRVVLAAGVYTIDAPSRPELAPTGIALTGMLTIRGAGAADTIIQRTAGSTSFGLIRVLGTGRLTLERLTLTGGASEPSAAGGGIDSLGQLIVRDSVIESNGSTGRGGGISIRGGAATLVRTTVRDNHSQDGGGILLNDGTLEIVDSAIIGNHASVFGGGIFLPGFAGTLSTLSITNSTVGANVAPFGGALQIGIGDFIVPCCGTVVTIVYSTIANNHGLVGAGGLGGPYVAEDPVIGLKGTILAGNRHLLGLSNCRGVSMISAGHNMFDAPNDCPTTLQDTDMTADPELGDLIDDLQPGRSHYPLLAGSPAVDAGGVAPRDRRAHWKTPRGKGPRHAGDCLATDQVGQKRVGPCDIGAVEQQATTLNAVPSTAAPGDIVFATWAGVAAASPVDWIGLYRPGTTAVEFIDWVYVSCTKAPAAARPAGTCNVVLPSPLATGTYHLRLLANDGFEVLATSNEVLVRAN